MTAYHEGRIDAAVSARRALVAFGREVSAHVVESDSEALWRALRYLAGARVECIEDMAVLAAK